MRCTPNFMNARLNMEYLLTLSTAPKSLRVGISAALLLRPPLLDAVAFIVLTDPVIAMLGQPFRPQKRRETVNRLTK